MSKKKEVIGDEDAVEVVTPRAHTRCLLVIDIILQHYKKHPGKFISNDQIRYLMLRKIKGDIDERMIRDIMHRVRTRPQYQKLMKNGVILGGTNGYRYSTDKTEIHKYYRRLCGLRSSLNEVYLSLK